MYRDEAVELMTNTVDDYNRYMAVQNNIPSDQIEEYIKQGRKQMEFVNGMLYDRLKESGIICG
jgi:hypothetical protein